MVQANLIIFKYKVNDDDGSIILRMFNLLERNSVKSGLKEKEI